MALKGTPALGRAVTPDLGLWSARCGADVGVPTRVSVWEH